MDKDIEIMKLQIAGDSYGSPLVTSISVLFGLLVSLLILITGFAIQMGNMEAFRRRPRSGKERGLTWILKPARLDM